METGYQDCSSSVGDGPLTSVRYTGPSMNPTLRCGDRLELIPCEPGAIRRGDVVVFHPPEDEGKVAHRVIAMDCEGIRTRGDNSCQADDWLVSPADVIGRVVSAQRGSRRIRVYGGGVGRFLGFVCRSCLAIRRRLFAALRPAYFRLARSGALRRWVPASIKTRVIRFRRPAGTELHLLMGNRVIGKRAPREQRWRIRPPFGLFVEQAALCRDPRDSGQPPHEGSPDE